MLDEACAAAMVACFNTNPPQVRGRTVYVQFSNHRELKIDQSHSVIVSTNHFSTRYQFVGYFSFFYFGRTNSFTAQHNLSNESVTNTYIHTQIDRWRNKYKQIHTHTHKCIQSTKWTHNEQKLFPFETCPFCVVIITVAECFIFCSASLSLSLFWFRLFFPSCFVLVSSNAALIIICFVLSVAL